MSTIAKERLIEDLKASTQNASGMFEISDDTICALMSMLIATPSPVVPDEMTPKQASRSYCGEVRGYRDGWNACRAAMLQAGKSTAIQDGWVLVPKEITCEMDDAAWEAYHETRCMSDIWAALIAAAPKQEVNRG
ncbi:TPA: hypothetical protein KFH97_003007 [Escherichia coli]|nr:hypothetical protein [Escherichia coli]